MEGNHPPTAESQQTLERVIQCDHFYYEGSNNHWRDAFARISNLRPFDIVTQPIQTLWDLINDHKPHHIHLGMSVKGDSVPVDLLAAAKRKFGCSISHFYGDARFVPYHFRTANVVDRVYFTNTNFCEWAQHKGKTNFHYLVCPTDPNIFYPMDLPKIHEVVFVGNNNDPERPPILKEVAERFNLTIYGTGWEGTGLPAKPAAYHHQFREIVSSSKVILSIFSRRWCHLKQCFSNRLINSLACGGTVVQTYTPDLENVFQHKEHVLLFQTYDEMFEMIKLALQDESLREQLGKCGKEEVYAKYTYDKSVARVLNEGKWERESRPQIAHFPPNLTDQTLVLSQGGLSLASSPQPCAECPKPGELWRDHLAIITRDRINISLTVDTIPADVMDRLDRWRECRRLILSPGHLTLNGETPNISRWKDELRFLGFLPEKLQNDEYIFKRGSNPDSNLDRWFDQLRAAYQVRFGHKPIELFSMEWCLNHPLTDALKTSGLLKGRVLYLWSYLGDWPFALQWLGNDMYMIGLEASWKAIDYATETYGHKNLRFLPPVHGFFSDDYFDTVVILSMPDRFTTVKPILQNWKRITKPTAKAFIGLFPADNPLPTAIMNDQWLKTTFGEPCVEHVSLEAGCFAAVLRIADSQQGREG